MRRLLPSVAAGVVTLCLTAPAHAASVAGSGISPTTNAGFVMTPPDVRSVSAYWTVPTVSCNTPDASVRFGVELADADSGTHLSLGVDVDCRAGIPSYVASLTAGKGRARLQKVSAGDEMSASLKAGSTGVDGSFVDYTAGWSDGLLIDYVIAPTQAGVLVSRRFGASGLRPLADFGSFVVSSSRVDGHTLMQPIERLQMRPPGDGGPEVRVSNLHRPAGAFTAAWIY